MSRGTGPRRCVFCEGPLPESANARTRYCSASHRVAAHRARRAELELAQQQLDALDALDALDEFETVPLGPAVPRELRTGRRWVRWRSILRNGRPTKLPLDLDGHAASSTDPATWCTFEDAARSEVGNGLGVVLVDTDDIVCVDLDRCLVDGRPLPALRRLLKRLPATWCEVSPSGDGLHVFGRSRRLTAGRRTMSLDGLAVEAYPAGRFITVTGATFGDCLELADLDDVLEYLLGRLD